MKRILMTITCLFIGLLFCVGQGRSISRNKKLKEPVVLSSDDTLKVGDVIVLQEGTLESGNFKFVQLLNGMNEPIQLANSRSANVKQEIKFFKEQDGVQYAFTKFFCINIESAAKAGEIKSPSIIKLKKIGTKENFSSESKYDKLKELKQLLDDGVLTKEEFDTEKKKLLDSK